MGGSGRDDLGRDEDFADREWHSPRVHAENPRGALTASLGRRGGCPASLPRATRASRGGAIAGERASPDGLQFRVRSPALPEIPSRSARGSGARAVPPTGVEDARGPSRSSLPPAFASRTWREPRSRRASPSRPARDPAKARSVYTGRCRSGPDDRCRRQASRGRLRKERRVRGTSAGRGKSELHQDSAPGNTRAGQPDGPVAQKTYRPPSLSAPSAP
jgi:hypothetical protein